MPLPKVEGLLYLSSAQVLAVTETPAASDNVTIAAGFYYLNSVYGASAALLGYVASQLTSNATLAGTYSCSVSDDSDSSTGKVTLSATGLTSFQIAWTGTTIRDILGFTGTITGAASYLSPEHAEGLWLPTTGLSDLLAPLPTSAGQKMGAPEADLTSALSPSGHRVSLGYSKRYKENFNFKPVLGKKTWKNVESVVNESFEKFWEDIVRLGRPIRVHTDRSDDALYWPMYLDNAGDLSERIKKRVGNWDGAQSLCDIEIRMREALDG